MADEDVREAIYNKNWQSLTIRDQLNQAKQNHRVLSNFKEGNINFAPTYKYLDHLEAYDEKRIPAYCDRILWEENEFSRGRV
jgi:hypothetical protein